MSTTSWAGRIAPVLAGIVIAGAAVALTGCQTGVQAPAPAPISVPRHGPVDQRLLDEYGGRPADRVAEEIQRRIGSGQLPSTACLQHSIVEHPDGGYHLVCGVAAPAP